MVSCKFTKYVLHLMAMCLVCLPFSIRAQLLPPVIAVPPLGTSVQNGGTATFSATVVSLTTPSFSWLFNGQPVSSVNTSIVNSYILGVGTISTLTVSNVVPANTGSYSVKVSNGVGSPVTSLGANLSVVGGIMVDNVTSTNSGSVGGTNLTWLHTVGTGANGLLVVSVSTHSGRAVSSVTYGGMALTKMGSVINAAGTHVSAEMWFLNSPPPGAANIVVTLSGKDTFAAGAASFFGVSQTQPFGLLTNATGTANTPLLNISASAGQAVLDAVAVHAATSGAAGNGQFPLWNQFSGNSAGDVWGSSSIAAGGSNVTMSWSTSGNGAGEWVSLAVALNPAGNTPLLSSVLSALTSKGFNLQLSGPVGSTVVIEASSDMVHWVPISTNAAPTGSVSCTDTNAKNLPFRYYRAMIQ
jgi:Immunoglobulin domain